MRHLALFAFLLFAAPLWADSTDVALAVQARDIAEIKGDIAEIKEGLKAINARLDQMQNSMLQMQRDMVTWPQLGVVLVIILAVVGLAGYFFKKWQDEAFRRMEATLIARLETQRLQPAAYTSPGEGESVDLWDWIGTPETAAKDPLESALSSRRRPFPPR